MARSLVDEIASVLWDLGQGTGWVSPSIQRTIKVSESRLGDPALSDAQRDLLARIAFGAHILGGLQIFQVLSGDQPPRKKLRRTLISSSLMKESKA
jgi:hypothetical protein